MAPGLLIGSLLQSKRERSDEVRAIGSNRPLTSAALNVINGASFGDGGTAQGCNVAIADDGLPA
jgi:hypothetical protein